MIIVTGGAGFIGRNIIKELNQLKYKDILVVDCLENGKKYENLVDLVISDYMDKDRFINNIVTNSYIKDIDVIFHQGACSCTMEWNGKYMMENNYQYSKDLLLYCIKRNVPFIYASSASVYGKDTSVIKKKDCFERPINVYSYSKFLFDNYVSSILSKTTSQICGLRYFNVYGPYEFNKERMASIIFRLYKQIKHKKNPTLFIGSKDFKRDFIYVDDIVNINLWMWYHNISGVFDCGTGKAESFESVVNVILSFFKKKMIIEYIPIPKKIKKHYQTFTQANTVQLKNIGYNKPFIDLNTGVHQYLNWLTHNDI